MNHSNSTCLVKCHKEKRVTSNGNIRGQSLSNPNNLYVCPLYLRPEMDTEWTYIRDPIESKSMVLKGLIPETEYQFVVRAVNVHGVSPPSNINSPVRTLGKAKNSATVTDTTWVEPPWRFVSLRLCLNVGQHLFVFADAHVDQQNHCFYLSQCA